MVMFFAFENVTRQMSVEYAERYAASSAEALSAHIAKEIGIISVAAHSNDVLNWLNDEFNDDKKERAFNVFSSVVSQLYSYNLYIGVASSLNEYRAEIGEASRIIFPVAVLHEDEPMDAWFFDTVKSEQNYIIKVDIDHILQRKRVWLDYKILHNGEVLGVICTGLEFSHIAGELFSQYEQNNMRGIVIDNTGTIYMDSYLMDSNQFLHNEYTTALSDEFSNAVLVDAVKDHLETAEGYWREIGHPSVTRLTQGQYKYMTIAPVRHTNWSLIILSDTTTLFDATYSVPIIIIVLLLLIAFAVSSSIASYRILFKPLRLLDDSLAQLNEHTAEELFGAERNDELGHLSNTIQDLFNKANIDPLTGLFNRRYMDSTIERVMGLLSRSGGLLSVLMLDIDFFKRYNDTYGHDAGDKCLQSVAHALAESVSRVDDIIVRYGGEEFAVILPNTDAEGARFFADKLLTNVKELNIPHEKNEAAPCVTVSIGVTTGKTEYKQTLEMYLKRADEALYTSKESGRNKFTYLDFIGKGDTE